MTEEMNRRLLGLEGRMARMENGVRVDQNIVRVDGDLLVSGHIVSELADGWIADTVAWTYASPTTFTRAGATILQFPVGTKARYKQGGAYKYSYLIGVSGTTITMLGDGLAAGAITDVAYSYAEMPQGWPDVFAWTPVLSSTGATFAYNIRNGYYSVKGRRVSWQAYFNFSGAPGGTTTNDLVVALPAAAASLGGGYGALYSYWGSIDFPTGYNQLSCFYNPGSTNLNLVFCGDAIPKITAKASCIQGAASEISLTGEFWL